MNAGNRSYLAEGWAFSGPAKGVEIGDSEGASAGSYAALFNKAVHKIGGDLS
jgi:hypothetical protein